MVKWAIHSFQPYKSEGPEPDNIILMLQMLQSCDNKFVIKRTIFVTLDRYIIDTAQIAKPLHLKQHAYQLEAKEMVMSTFLLQI